MISRRSVGLWSCLVLAISLVPGVLAHGEQPPVDFNRDIRPLLSDICYTCHGPDEKTREGGLRLDLKESAFGEADSGGVAIVPGDIDESMLIERIMSDDEYEKMPPPDSGKQLTPEQVELFKRWIEEAAPWREHWSFITAERPEPPTVKVGQCLRNPIDNFVVRRLEKEGLRPSPEADRHTLIRRVTLDLTGLPPTADEIDAFLKDDEPGAYERVVDRLLASPRYGEHKARYWLDAIRYGDTHGLHLDNYRSSWPYRDWIIEAYNKNMPFDQFTREQLAGDLLKEPTTDQLVASGYIRSHVTTSEGGSINEEFLVRYAVDRTETTGTVWLGLTLGCAVCHEHKYDPISQKEFYQLYAFFNSTAEKAMDGNKAFQQGIDIQVPTMHQRQQLENIDAKLAAVRGQMDDALAELEYQEPKGVLKTPQPAVEEIVWIDDAIPAGVQPQGDTPWQFVEAADHPVFSGAKSHTRTAKGRSQHFFNSANPPLLIEESDTLFTYVYIDSQNPPRQIMLQFNDGSWEHRAYWGENMIDWGKDGTASRRRVGDLPKPGEWTRLTVSVDDVGLNPGAKLNGWAFTQYDGTVHWDKSGIQRTGVMSFESQLAWEEFIGKNASIASKLPYKVSTAFKKAADQRGDDERRAIHLHFLENIFPAGRETLKPLREEITRLEAQREAVKKDAPYALIAKELPQPRPAFLLDRGEYDRRKEEVEREVPAIFPPFPKDAPRNRLGLAEWLLSREHPLTARVTVNRIWQQYFGTGLVRTSEDFGSQGEWPSHPKMLDWLAVEFIESGWDVKRLHRLIVNSATYRQSSKATPELLKVDPQNRLLTRGPRFRMDAEMVRDAVLYNSGLLVEQLGGPSVKPYQPLGLWYAVGYTRSNTANFKQDSGDALYRRSLYTFWKRTSPPPTMQLLDAPTRETCTVRRERTNTPLAALALMNDVQFFEAARHFAERIIREGGDAKESRAAYAFEQSTGRPPNERELAVLTKQYDSHLATYTADKEAAAKLLESGDSPRDETLDVSEHAAWTMVANLVLNLDEAITKR
jgi:hypothetical protein